ncbi:MAG: hypothetical protein ABI380_14475 [Edaphobacter sp.]
MANITTSRTWFITGASTGFGLQRMRGKLDQWKTDLDTWQSTTLGADFPEGE